MMMVTMTLMATTEKKNMELSLGLLFLLVMLLLLILLFLLACRPWRFFLSSSSSSFPSSRRSSTTPKNDDIERPLFSESLDGPSDHNYDLTRNIDESRIEIDGNISSPRTHGYASKERVQADLHFSQGDSLVLDVVADTSEDSQVNHTLKRNAITNWPVKIAKHVRREDSKDVCKDRSQVVEVKDSSLLRSSLTLEVISGPSHGLSCFRESTNTAMLPLILGRVSPSDILLKDTEVSGKHAQITWNISQKAKWEMVDLGSLNGTFLNSQAIHHPDVGSRRRSDPVELADGDVITLGTSSKISVQISQHTDSKLSYGIGVASDPMSMRRGGKQLPMEDMCYFQCPLPGVEQFGLFGIFDGHGGAGAAKAASKILPQNVTDILSNAEKRERAVSLCDASDILREAFSLTEAAITHQYEGCTATVLLVWIGHNKEVFAQCANVGDSACVISVGGKQIAMTEDHRVVSMSERTRFVKIGMPMKDGETRLCGINLGRMLGDKFLKEQDSRFTAEPYISQVVHISKASDAAFALLASDGLWDVISIKKAVQLVHQAKEKYNDSNSGEMVAKYVLNEAKTLRTKDNTTVIYLNFDSMRTNHVS
ncbi:protein phosphatase 2C 70 [Iris pallida]|uniref:protein-serine/threonine phosphatase n=1 Tax=Iris pallida TaxID=29817 RepID=A0AAX6IIQ7_IRIPA|nr:protein phosphatase 2C 70 [Iris pallida]